MRIAVIVVLLAFIIAAGVFLVKRAEIGGPKSPQWLLDRPVERIDSESLELITKTRGEWDRLGAKNWKYKNPDSGEYTMVLPIVCAACGEKIPMLDLPSADMDAQNAQMRELMDEYECPKCGGQAILAGSPVGPPP